MSDAILDTGGDGPAVLMVHGVGSRGRAWAEVATLLGPAWRCIAYDLRGHGDATWPGPFGLDDLVADLEALRRRLSLGGVHVVGHSLGGIVAAAYAAAHPGAVNSLGMISSAAFRSPEAREKLGSFVRLLEEQGTAAFIPTLVDRWYTDRFRAERPDLVAARVAQLAAMDPRTYLQTYRLFAEAEVGPLLPDIAVPALVMTGAEDAGCGPALNRQMAAALPQAELVVLPGLKHSILVEAPGTVAAALAGFLRRVVHERNNESDLRKKV